MSYQYYQPPGEKGGLAGEQVLTGKSNLLDSVNLDRWMGGVHLTSCNIWCWDPVTASFSKVT
jgi:hypothetical protein